MSDARTDLLGLEVSEWDWADPTRAMGDPANARQAAVLVLFGVLDSVPAESAAPVAGDLDVLLQRRAPTMGHHAGQISFPGGGVEASDPDMPATAIREAVEETGLDPAGVEVLATLPPLALPVSNNLVTPVLAWWARTSSVAVVDDREAVEVFRMPVADLLDPQNRGTVVFTRGGRDYRSLAFSVRGVVVWGFTALVLDRLFDELGWAMPWDPHRTIVLPEF